MPSDRGPVTAPIPVGKDGFFHPATEQELVALVQLASQQKVQLRVRGAAHSVAHAVYTDPLATIPNQPNWQTPPSQTPVPQTPGIEVMLDRYRGWSVRDATKNLVEAEAGIHLGPDPSDPTHTATKETSLLWQLWNRTPSWTMSDLGGITHQTISGFTATGSSGGSLTYSANDDLYGFRVIDAAGNVSEFTRDDPDPSAFHAMAPNLGLLGVVSTVILQCVDAFNITGQEAVTTVNGCAVDLFGPGDQKRPSLEQHLRDVEYTRIEWWPQPGADRVLVWQAKRIPVAPGFKRNPYREFGADPKPEEVLLSILLTILGNLDDLEGAKPQIARTFARAKKILEQVLDKVTKLPVVGALLAKLIAIGAKDGVDEMIDLLKPEASTIKDALPVIFPALVALAIPLDGGKPQTFQDHSWSGLPMDNAADDQLLPTGFSEIWLPLPRTQQVMQLLYNYFKDPDVQEAYRRTGLFAWEFYAAKPSPFSLSPAYSDGQDEWKDGVFRIDPYWFEGNAGDPAEAFYPQLWELLRDDEIPFRLHWGKYQPIADANLPGWVEFFKDQYPRWDDFLKLRTQRDPTNTFLTSYWRDRFGLGNASNPGK